MFDIWRDSNSIRYSYNNSCKVNQNKSGYQFTVNDRSSYFDWFNGFFEVKFSVNQLDGGGDYDGTDDKIATMINSSTLLINNLNIKQNGKVVYEGNSLFITTFVKILIEYSNDYAKSIATREYFYLDNQNKIDLDGDDINFGYVERLNATKGNNVEVSCIIPLNRYSFFKSLENNLLPPIQIQISLTLADDNILIYKLDINNDVDRVVVSKFVLWI